MSAHAMLSSSRQATSPNPAKRIVILAACAESVGRVIPEKGKMLIADQVRDEAPALLLDGITTCNYFFATRTFRAETIEKEKRKSEVGKKEQGRTEDEEKDEEERKTDGQDEDGKEERKEKEEGEQEQ